MFQINTAFSILLTGNFTDSQNLEYMSPKEAKPIRIDVVVGEIEIVQSIQQLRRSSESGLHTT